jgi:hypothetical protein
VKSKACKISWKNRFKFGETKMELNTTQVAKKLGLSNSGVRGLSERGLLKDLRDNIKKRHIKLFDSREVNALKKVYKKRTRNYSPETIAAVKDHQKNGIISSIRRIEDKIDYLIKIWS